MSNTLTPPQVDEDRKRALTDVLDASKVVVEEEDKVVVSVVKRQRRTLEHIEKARLPLRYIPSVVKDDECVSTTTKRKRTGVTKYSLDRDFQVLGRGAHGDAVVRAFDQECQQRPVAVKVFNVDRQCVNAVYGQSCTSDNDLCECTGNDECGCYCFYRELWSLKKLLKLLEKLEGSEDNKVARCLPRLHDFIGLPSVVKPYIVLDADYSSYIARARHTHHLGEDWSVDVQVADLHCYITSHGPMLDDSRVNNIGDALESALRAIHSVGVVHRDVKPGNVLLVQVVAKQTCKTATLNKPMICDEWPVLIDFSSSNIWQSTSTISTIARNCITTQPVSKEEKLRLIDDHSCSTLTFGISTLVCRAPEMLLRMPYSFEVDYWGLGTLLYFCEDGHYLFPYMSDEEEILYAMARDARFGEFAPNVCLSDHPNVEKAYHSRTPISPKASSTLLRKESKFHRLLSLDPSKRLMPSETLGCQQ